MQDPNKKDSIRLLDALDKRAEERIASARKVIRSGQPSIPPPLPAKARSGTYPKAKATSPREVRDKLLTAWELLTECQEAIKDWRSRTTVDVGLHTLQIRVRNAIDLVDDAAKELEPPPSRKVAR